MLIFSRSVELTARPHRRDGLLGDWKTSEWTLDGEELRREFTN